MKKFAIVSLVIAIVSAVAYLVHASKNDILDDDDYEEFFGNDEGNIDIDVNIPTPEDVQDFSEEVAEEISDN